MIGAYENIRRCSTDLSNKQGEKYIFAFVGLPARGKSYLSSKLAKYLDWIGYDSKVFSIGLYRRKLIGCNCDWTFFIDEKTEEMREKCVIRVMDDMIEFLGKGGKVGIIDGTNTRRDRRKMIEDYIKNNMPGNLKYNFMWIESICDLQDIIEQNIIKNKLNSPDYKGWNEEQAVNDFRDRIATYEKVYENLSPERDGENCTYIQLININREIVIRNVKGFLQSKVLSFLVNLILGDKPIYFTHHGGSENNSKGIVGGDSPLSEAGRKYAKALYDFLSQHDDFKKGKRIKEDCIIYTSTLKRSLQTAEHLSPFGKLRTYKCLDDLNVGICDAMSYQEIKEKYPKDYEDRLKDKLNYRYPRGESYKDLINRIEPLIYELERRQGPVIVVGHQATIRCLYGYFTHTPLELIPHLDLPVHTVIRKLPQAYGFDEERFSFDILNDTISRIKVEKKFNYEDIIYNIPQN